MRIRGLLPVALVASLITAGTLHAQGTDAPRPPETEVPTAPVVLDGTTLFRVRGVTSFPAEARARLIADRLRSIADDQTVSIDAFRTVDEAAATRILAGSVLVTTIIDADATLEQIGRDQLGSVLMGRMRQAVADYRAARSPAALRRSALNVALATVVLILALMTLRWFWQWMDRQLARRVQSRIQTVGIQSFELIRAERLRSVLRSALLAFRMVIILVFSLTYLGYALAQLPWTRGLERDSAAVILGPLGVMGRGLVDSIPSLIFLVVLIFAVRLGLRIIRLFFDAVGSGGVKLANFEPEWADPTYKIVRVAIVAFAIVVAYPYIPGSSTAAFQGVSLFVGIVFSLGSSSVIANIAAGYMITYRRALKVGDRVRIGGAFGDVVSTRLQVTHLRSVKNEEIIIPNSQILNNEVINYTSLARGSGLILHTEVGIGYETPWRQVEAMLIAAADRTEGLAKEPRPFVLEMKLGDFAVTYEINAYCSNVPMMGFVYADLHRHILDVFNEHGVQIMTPAYEGDPPEPKIVPQKNWFAAPAKPPKG